tara:strand:+ start:135 stop:473 length:339 start_codon:yes stop_codon:yes gene_type:complete
MAITVNLPNTPGEAFTFNATSADVSGTEELKAAPTAQSIYLEWILINSVAAITVTILDAAADLLGPFNFAATAPGFVCMKFDPPIKLTAEQALNVDASGAGAVCVAGQGFLR